MKFRNWKESLHTIRKREIDLVFGHLPRKSFRSGLEIGAGDGFQTRFLAGHCDKFISSDLNFSRIREELKLPGVSYVRCDADSLSGVFENNQFDFVFSSNVLEHLSRPADFLSNTAHILSDEGYVVHIIPSRFLKFAYVVFHFPNLFFIVLDRVGRVVTSRKKSAVSFENNINKAESKKKNKYLKILLPQVHGNFNSHAEEFAKFGKKSWEDLFQENGFIVEKYLKGPAASGYGFNLNGLRNIFEYLGWSSEHIFILRKKI